MFGKRGSEFAQRNDYNAYFGRKTIEEQREERRKQYREGAKVQPEAIEAYRRELRDVVERDGSGGVDLGEFFCRLEYLYGDTNERTMQENLKSIDALVKKLDEYEDDGEMLHELIQETQPLYEDGDKKTQRTLSDLLQERVANCHSQVLGMLAIRSRSERLRDMPVFLQHFKNHIRILLMRDGQWLVMEHQSWRPVEADEIDGTVLSSDQAFLQSFAGIKNKATAYKGSHEELCTIEYMFPLSRPDSRHFSTLPEREYKDESNTTGISKYRPVFYAEGQRLVNARGEQIRRQGVNLDIQGAREYHGQGKREEVHDSKRRRFLKTAGMAAVGLAAGAGATTILERTRAFERLDRLARRYGLGRASGFEKGGPLFETADEHKAFIRDTYIETQIGENGKTEMHFKSSFPFHEFFVDAEYAAGESSKADARKARAAVSHLRGFNSEVFVNSVIEGEGVYDEDVANLTDIMLRGHGNDEARARYYLSAGSQSRWHMRIQCYANHRRVLVNFGSDTEGDWYALGKPGVQPVSLADLRGTVIVPPGAYVESYLGMMNTNRQQFLPEIPRTGSATASPDQPDMFPFAFAQAPTRLYDKKEYERQEALAAQKTSGDTSARQTADSDMTVRYLSKAESAAYFRKREMASEAEWTEITEQALINLVMTGGLHINNGRIHASEFLKLKGFPLHTLDLAYTELEDPSLRTLPLDIPLRTVIIYGSSFSPALCDHLKLYQQLADLLLPDNRLAELPPIPPQVTYLDISQNPISDLRSLRGVPLRRIDLRATDVTSLEGLSKADYLSGRLTIETENKIDVDRWERVVDPEVRKRQRADALLKDFKGLEREEENNTSFMRELKDIGLTEYQINRVYEVYLEGFDSVAW